MGYRSDVGWACDPAVAEVIGAVLELNPKESNPDVHSLVDHGRDSHWGQARLDRLFFEHVKWYEGYPDIDAIEQFMTDAEHGNWGITDDDGNEVHSEELFRYARVGEDHADIEVRGSGYWDITPVTSIQY